MQQPQPKTVTITPAQQRFAGWARDVLVYTVVLNLFVEWWDAIVIDSFTISLLTAIVLKVLLDILTTVEHRDRQQIKDPEAKTHHGKKVKKRRKAN